MKKLILKICILAHLSLFLSLQAYCLAKWTIMLYLDGDNNLERNAINDFLEIASIGSNSQVNFIIQFDRISGYDTRYGNWTNTQRFRITQNMEPTIENSISDWGDGFGGREVNMGDPEVLASFVRWAKQNYPAQYYALILWDHGDGWRSMNYVAEKIEEQLKQPGLSLHERKELEKTLKELKRKIKARRYQKSVCFDSTSSDELTLKEVRLALSSQDCLVDILAFDACLMGMIEVAYEIRNCANFMVASEETIYTTGFPYDYIAGDITNNPDYLPDELCKRIVYHYKQYYNYYGTETLSAIDLSYSEQVFQALNNFCQTAIDINNQWIYFFLALNQTPVFDDQDYKDMKNFFEKVLVNASNPEIISKTETIILLFNEMVISNFGEPKGKGLSIYFPDSLDEIDLSYSPENLEFAQGMWKDFLQSLYIADLTAGFTVLLNENFSSGLPANWTIVDGNNDGKTWTNTNPKQRTIPNLSSPFMIADSDWAGRIWMNEELLTPTIYVNPSDRCILVFDHYFLSYSSEIADVDITVNGGAWQNIIRFRYQDTSGRIIVPLNQYINNPGISSIQIRWNYHDAYDALYWAIDNILVLKEGTLEKDGDIDRNGIIDITDVILCLRISVGLEITINNQTYQNPYPSEIIETADLNNDNTVDITDVILVLRLAINLN